MTPPSPPLFTYILPRRLLLRNDSTRFRKMRMMPGMIRRGKAASAAAQPEAPTVHPRLLQLANATSQIVVVGSVPIERIEV
jgi:hypothetical protein